MNLNLSSGSGGSGNYIKYSPQANAWTRKNDEGKEVEFQFPRSVFDHENIKTGWMLIATGQYEFIPDEVLGKKGAQPSPEHKRGFKVTFFSPELGGVAEYSANGAGANMGLEALWGKIQAQAQANAGKLPVVEYKGSTPEKVGKGTTRIPNFEISSWVARPAAMTNGGAKLESSSSDQFSKPAPTPVAKPAPSPAMSDDEMFS